MRYNCDPITFRFSPIGISSLVCVAVLEMKDPENTFKSISYYMMTVLVGLAIQGMNCAYGHRINRFLSLKFLRFYTFAWIIFNSNAKKRVKIWKKHDRSINGRICNSFKVEKSSLLFYHLLIFTFTSHENKFYPGSKNENR